jgi:hypothetical protein
MQALVGLWRIFAREGTIPPAQADAVFARIVQPYAAIHSDRDLFDAGRLGVRALLEATGSAPGAAPQERIVDLLAGRARQVDDETHAQMAQEIVRILEAQRIVSLNSIFELADHLEEIAKGGKPNTAVINRLHTRLSEVQARAALTGAERNALAYGYWIERHIEAQRRMNLRAAIERAAATMPDKDRVRDMRGLLAPILRDTLVAFNYAHYAPPGAQVLYTNPLFVRSHDFLGLQGTNQTWRGTELFGTGWPSNGGGRLVGSLSGLPYALAEAEQNFLVPSQTQALIWADLVPQMILSSKIPRWWRVTPPQMHWVALHLRYGQYLLAEAALNPEFRNEVLELLATQAVPARTRLVASLLERGEVKTAVDKVTPTELFVLARDMAPRHKGATAVPIGTAKAGGRPAGRSELCRYLTRLRHAQAHAGQLVPAGVADPADLPHPDGLFEPRSGGELGIQHALLGRAGRRDARASGATEPSHPRVDPETGGAHLRFPPGGLARGAALPAAGGRRYPRQKPVRGQ